MWPTICSYTRGALTVAGMVRVTLFSNESEVKPPRTRGTIGVDARGPDHDIADDVRGARRLHDARVRARRDRGHRQGGASDARESVTRAADRRARPREGGSPRQHRSRVLG